jgi:photosystem II stability/assembly factor-like uncharacterized protein
MITRKTPLTLLAFGASVAMAFAAPKHEMFVAGQIANGFIVGAKVESPSGLYRRVAEGEYQHFGENFVFIFNLAVDPRDRNKMYIPTLNGVLVSKDGGKRWRQGTSWDATEPKDVFVDPNAPDNVYLALPDGIMVSRDAGETWVRSEKGLPVRGKYTQVIKVDRTKAGRVLAGCESGIYLSTDAGKSWRRVFTTQTTTTDLRQSPHDSNHWVATTQSNGVIQTRDGGLTWTAFSGLPSKDAWYNIAFDATHPQRMAISSWTYGVHVTEDGGRTWQERNAGLPEGEPLFRVGIDPDTGRLFAGVFRTALYRSDDFGRTWIKDGLEGSLIYNFIFLPVAAK